MRDSASSYNDDESYASAGVDWTFRTTDTDTIHAVRAPCEGWLALNATSADGRRRVTLMLHAPPHTYGERLPVPTDGGFSAEPGCRESYHATVTLAAYEQRSVSQVLGREGGWRRLADVERSILQTQMPRAALEFGGSWQCASAAV